MNPRLLVVRDQLALRRLGDEALRTLVPTLQAAQRNILDEIAAARGKPADLAWYVRRRQDLYATIDQQLRAVADRLEVVLPAAEVAAFRQGLEQAQQYLEAAGVAATPADGAPGVALAAPVGRLQTRTGPTPRPYKAPAVTGQQLLAVARQNGLATFPGLVKRSLGEDYTIETATARWADGNARAIRQQLEGGFLLGKSNSEMVADVRDHLEGASRAQLEALVRTSMMTASQTAHDVFYQANEEALGAADGAKYKWDASNDGRLCPTCAPLDETRYATRAEVPQHPAHWNCRCVVLPVTPLDDLLEKTKGSFLEGTPVRYGEDGKRLPPPDGYDGPKAYKQPMRVDGELRWVRRVDMPAGKNSVGDMLVRANDETALGVLGSKGKLAEFRRLTGKGGRFVKDPQGAVVSLLRPDGGMPQAPRPPAPPPKPLSETRPRVNNKTTKDINMPYANTVDRDTRSAGADWAGSGYTPTRAVQFAQAKEAGAELTPYQERQVGIHVTSPAFRRVAEARADKLEQFITEAPLFKGKKLYRGMGFPTEQILQDEIDKLVAGEKTLALESWSTKRTIASKFARSGRNRLILELEENLHGVPLGDLSHLQHEAEVLMPSGVRYEVVDIIDYGSEKTVKVRQVPAAGS